MKPKLLVLASTFPGTLGDGTPAFVLDLARQQAKDFAVTVITPMVPGAAPIEVIDELNVVRYRYWFRGSEDLAHGAILDNLKARKSRLIQVPFLMLGLWRQLRTEVRVATRAGHPVAGIHAHWVIPQGIVARLAAPKLPLLVTTHGGDIYALNNAPMLALKRWVFGKAAAISTVNSQMKARLIELGVPERKIHLLPMGVDTGKVARIGANAKKRSGQLLVVGRLVEKKGIAYLFEALRSLQARGVSFERLVVIGDGPIREKLVAQAAGLPVEFMGQQSSDVVLRTIAESEVMVLPSITADNGDQEGLPVTLLEGGAGGICVVASALPGIDEVIESEVSGLLVPQKDSAALADALERVLTDGALRAKLAGGIAASVQRFDIATIGAGYNRVIGKILHD